MLVKLLLALAAAYIHISVRPWKEIASSPFYPGKSFVKSMSRFPPLGSSPQQWSSSRF